MSRLLVVILLTCMTGSLALSCPTCYGAEDSQMTQAMNMAIMSLLGITGGVLVAVVAFFVYLRRRSMFLNRLFSNRLN